jgi:hypothetical protein
MLLDATGATPDDSGASKTVIARLSLVLYFRRRRDRSIPFDFLGESCANARAWEIAPGNSAAMIFK